MLCGKTIKKYRWFSICGIIMCIGGTVLATPVKYVLASEIVSTEAEINADEEVFQVIFPSDTEHVFDFIMDPQRLISQTDAAAYEGSTFEEDSTLFFRRTDGGVLEDYSSSSDALVITNVGTMDVELVVTASVSLDEAEGIIMTNDSDFTDDMEASFYLALTDGEHTMAIGREETAIHTMLNGISKEDETCSEYRFWLTGAVNEKGDWSEVAGGIPKITVTWHMIPCKTEVLENTVLEGNDLLEDTQLSTVSGNKIEEAEE